MENHLDYEVRDVWCKVVTSEPVPSSLEGTRDLPNMGK